MDQVILDASVIVKWFSKEKGHEKALEILNQVVEREIVLIEPDLVFYELINALWFGKKLSIRKINRILMEFINLEPKVFLVHPDLTSEILKLINKYPITAYDAVYIALANLEKIPLITADTKHHRKEYSKHIVSLNEFRAQ